MPSYRRFLVALCNMHAPPKAASIQRPTAESEMKNSSIAAAAAFRGKLPEHLKKVVREQIRGNQKVPKDKVGNLVEAFTKYSESVKSYKDILNEYGWQVRLDEKERLRTNAARVGLKLPAEYKDK